jgi:hypothetical protein
MIARIMIDDEEEKSIVERLISPRNRPVSSQAQRNLGVRVNGAKVRVGFRMWTEGLPRRGSRTQPRVSTLGTLKINGSP